MGIPRPGRLPIRASIGKPFDVSIPAFSAITFKASSSIELPSALGLVKYVLSVSLGGGTVAAAS